MFYKVNSKISPYACEIIGIGHSKLEDSDKLSVISQNKFIRSLPKSVQQEICKDGKSIAEVAKVWNKMTWPKRIFFSGSTAELGALAVKDCFKNIEALMCRNKKIESEFDPYNSGKLDPCVIDAIIGATNTGDGYPSLADGIKWAIGAKESKAMCFDITEACTSGSMAIMQAHALIASGMCEKVLVVCAERAITLTPRENWQGSNLFGDAAFAFMVQRTTDKTKQSFSFFYNDCFPFDGNIDYIKKIITGFYQNGPKVHKFVGSVVVPTLVASVERAGIRVEDVKHVIFHQPSLKTLSFAKKELRKLWPGFKGKIHISEGIGNASSASFGHLLSTKYQTGIIKPNELVVTCTFGAGLSLAIIGLHFND